MSDVPDGAEGSAHTEGTVPDLVPARMLNEFVYCPRLFFLEWVQGEWRDSADTEEGRLVHRRVDVEAGRMGPPEGAQPIHARSVLLSSEREHLIARIDLVERGPEGVQPVDYKKGTAPAGGAPPSDPDLAQICAQGLVLRDAGYACTQGVLYYHGSRQRIDVPLDEALVERTRRQVADLRALAASATIPPPLVDSPKCPGCSLVGICLPDETNLLSGRASPVEHVPIRRLVPARDDALPVYVQTAYGAVGVRGDRIVVTRDKEEIHTSRLLDVAHLCLLGRITVSPHAVHVLCERGIPITHMSSGGWFYGVTKGMPHKNVDLRIAQYRSALDDSASLRLARVIVAGKVRNQRTLLRRNLGTRATAAVAEMTRLLTGIGVAPDLGQLLGHEGAAARTYFAHLGAMLSPSSSERRPWSFDFSARNRRPPRDPVNAVLSLGYALLTKDAFLILDAVGLDAYLGFLHRPRYGRPALALDLAEEFRALIVDSVVLTVLNTGEITPADFVDRAGACALTTEGRRRFIAAYERRMDTLVRHPLFGYSISYRRVLEVQARVLARTLLGELRTYRSFVTR